MNSDDIKEVFVELAPRVALVAMHKLGSSYDDTLDAVQQAYLRLDKKLEAPPHEEHQPLKNRDDVFRYIYGAVRSYVSHQRERTRTYEAQETLLWQASIPSAEPSAEAKLISREERRRLWAAIRQLDEPYRSIFTLLVKKEMALADIARQLGLTESGIYNQYKRGIRHLQKALEMRQE